jgi:hypothetical protein
MYGHLKWENVKVVANGELAAYTTSELVREINDTKVYKLYPDGDTGTKKWVDTLDCFNSQGYNWNSVYIINSFDRDSYTTAATTLCGEEEVAGDITVSLASDSPAANTIPINAANVTFAKFKFAGSGTISQLVLKRSGAGDTNDFLNVYLYDGDNRLVNGRSISSSTSKVTFINLDIQAPATISVVADMSHANGNGGNVSYFEIESASSITSDATIGGTFPIKGNNMATAAAVGGTLTVARPGSISNPKVGQQNVLLSQFKLTAGAEAISLKRIRMINGGDIASSKLTGLELKVSGTVVATAAGVDDDNYATFVFSPAYKITKGDNAIFYMYGDIAGSAKVGDTIKFYFEVGNDIYGIGDTYGFGAATVDSSDTSLIITMDTSASTEAFNLTLEGGALTIAFNGPVAADISSKAKDVVYLDLTLTASQDIEIRKTRIAACWDNDANGWDTMTTTVIDDFEDVKMVNKDTGVVLLGPVDGDASGWTAESAGTGSCSGGAIGVYYDFTDTYNIAAGDSLNVQVTADFISTLVSLAATDYVAFMLEGWGNSALVGTTGDINVMRYTGTTTAVDDSDIVPSTDTLGSTMTITAAELRVGLASLPQNATYVKATSLIDVVGFTLEAKGSDVTITQFKPTIFVDEDAGSGATYDAGVDASTGDTAFYGKNLISAVYLYDGDTKIAGPVGFSGTSSEYVDFDNLTYKITSGETKILTLKADLHNYTSSTYDYFAFDLYATTDITSQDSEGNDLTETNATGATFAAPNGCTAAANADPTIYMTVADAGTLAVEALDTPASTAIYFGQTGAELTKMRFSATNEGFYIDKLNVVLTDSSGGEAANGNMDEFTGLTLEYTNKAGSTLTQTIGFGSAATISFTGFASANRPYVPKDSDLTVTVKGNLNTWAAGADSEQTVYVCLEGGSTESAEAADFEATGVSGAKITGASLTGRARGQAMYIYRMFPEFAKVTTSTLEANDGKISGSTEEAVLRFTITAIGEPGAPDLLFDNVMDGASSVTVPATSGLIVFEVVASGQENQTPPFYLYDVTYTDNLVYSTTNADSIFGDSIGGAAENASAIIRLVTGGDLEDLMIPVGQSRTYEIRVDLSSFNDAATSDTGADYFGINLNLNEAYMVQYVDRSKSDKLGTITNTANIFKNKITGTVLYRE